METTNNTFSPLALILDGSLVETMESYGVTGPEVTQNALMTCAKCWITFVKDYPYTVATTELIEELELEPYSVVTIDSIGSEHYEFRMEGIMLYLVNIHLPNGEVVRNVKVMDQKFCPYFDHLAGGGDIIFGCNLIDRRDFVTSFLKGKSCLEFSITALN